jgi:hypothetical protein
MHTPGPWTATLGDEIIGAPVWWLIENADGVVCEALYASDSDARLIAAAPQMLRALQRLTHPAADDDDLAYALDVIRAATGAP